MQGFDWSEFHEEFEEALYDSTPHDAFESPSDPLGSYTGTSTVYDDPYPEQDVDDL